MTKIDNSLREQTIMMAMKALEVVSKALDILAAEKATEEAGDVSHGTEPDVCHGTEPDVCHGTETDVSHGMDTGISHGMDAELTRKDTDERWIDTGICHGTDTELTRSDTDEHGRNTDKNLCAATPLPSRGGAGGGVCNFLPQNKLVIPTPEQHNLVTPSSACARARSRGSTAAMPVRITSW